MAVTVAKIGQRFIDLDAVPFAEHLRIVTITHLIPPGTSGFYELTGHYTDAVHGGTPLRYCDIVPVTPLAIKLLGVS